MNFFPIKFVPGFLVSLTVVSFATAQASILIAGQSEQEAMIGLHHPETFDARSMLLLSSDDGSFNDHEIAQPQLSPRAHLFRLWNERREEEQWIFTPREIPDWMKAGQPIGKDQISPFVRGSTFREKEKPSFGENELARANALAGIVGRVVRNSRYADFDPSRGHKFKQQAGTHLGTCFRVAPNIVMTNLHVVKDAIRRGQTLHVQFNYQLNSDGEIKEEEVEEYEVLRGVFFYASAATCSEGGLDYALMAIRRGTGEVNALTSEDMVIQPQANHDLGDRSRSVLDERNLLAAGLPEDLETEVAQRSRDPRVAEYDFYPLSDAAAADFNYKESGGGVNFFQHPRDSVLSVATEDSKITEFEGDHLVFYETDTKPGSSGSPGFSDSWELIVLHCGEGKEGEDGLASNRGIRISSIVQDLRCKLKEEDLKKLGLGPGPCP